MNTTDTSHASNALAAALAGGLGLFAMLVVFAVLIFSFYIYWRIAAKAGYNGAVSLLLRCGATPRRSNSPDATVRASRPKATATASAPNLSAANASSKSRQRE